jgi:glycosyltransferase involved in cell wall biosynthesis
MNAGARAAASPLVSVITPVYNGEKYLTECIESVLAQTYQHWEYLIVDNCSMDDTWEIAGRYAKQDARIRLIRNPQHVSSTQNHNIGLAQMARESQYCKFVHADDWLFPECLARMVAIAVAHPSVGLVSAYRLDERRVNLDGLPVSSTVFPGRAISRATLLGETYVFGSQSSVLFRSDLMRDRPAAFDDSRFPRHPDAAACYEVLRGADFGFVHQVLTYTRRPPEARTSFSRRVNSYLAEGLVALVTYGPTFLGPAEYRRRHRRLLRRYYAFLGDNLLRRDGEFWNYHRRICAILDLHPGTLRLGMAAAGSLARRLTRPVRRIPTALRRQLR